MITYTYSNDEGISLEQREQAKAAWIEKLGKFASEFDEKNGFVNINFAITDENDKSFYEFTLSPPHHHSEFIIRFNEWIEAGRP